MSDTCEQPHALQDVPNETTTTNLPAGSELAPARLLPRTIDDVCNQPPGSFRKFIAEQHAEAERTEAELKKRIRDARGRAG